MVPALKAPTSSKLSGPEPFKMRTFLAVVSDASLAKGFMLTPLMRATARKSKSTWCLHATPVRTAGAQRPSFCPRALLGRVIADRCELARTWQGYWKGISRSQPPAAKFTSRTRDSPQVMKWLERHSESTFYSQIVNPNSRNIGRIQGSRCVRVLTDFANRL